METTKPRNWNRYRFAIAALALAAVIGGTAHWQRARLPKRFAPVVEGELYRSGTVTPEQLRRLHEEYGIARVISFLNPDTPESAAERTEAERLGLNWQNIPLRGNGASTPEDRARILALLASAAPPTLLHCAAGTNRTGLAVGLYRLHFQGWTLDETLAELAQFDFKDDPDHANLRQALAAEADLARRARLAPSSAPALSSRPAFDVPVP